MLIVMRSRLKNLVTGEVKMVWHLISAPNRKAMRVTHKEAVEYIKAKGLVMTYEKDGERIYDTPDEAFRKKYRNYPFGKMSHINYEGNIMYSHIEDYKL